MSLSPAACLLAGTRRSINWARKAKALCVSGRLSEAVELLCREVSSLDHQTCSILLQESINRREVKLGKRIHSRMITTDFTCNHYLNTKLLIFYAKIGELEVARYLFDEMPERSLVSWNTMISGYIQMGQEQNGLDLYRSMRSASLLPDQFTFASVLHACARLAMLEYGKRAHCLMIKLNIKANIIANSALIDMYLKCSCPCDGHEVFKRSPERNITMWTALISGFGQHGCAAEVLELFNQMLEDGFQPNHVTFLTVLSACGHAGLVDVGMKYFSSMEKDYGIAPRGEHCSAMVDMLGRAGRLTEACEFIKEQLPSGEHSVTWGALLGACRKHGNVELVELAAQRFFKLQPNNAGKYVVLSNAYAAYEMWGSVAAVWEKLRTLGLRKEPAWSSVEVQGKAYTFLVGDTSHEQSEQIYEACTALGRASTESAQAS